MKEKTYKTVHLSCFETFGMHRGRSTEMVAIQSTCNSCLVYGRKLLRAETPRGKRAKLRIVAASNDSDHSIAACSRHVHNRCYSSLTSRSWWIAHSTPRRPRVCNIPSFFQLTAPITCSVCGGWIWHCLHILVAVLFCYDRKARQASDCGSKQR